MVASCIERSDPENLHFENRAQSESGASVRRIDTGEVRGSSAIGEELSI
jgi:hypothetical protein